MLQTVFTRLLRREEQPDLSNSAGSYLHRAAVNAALDLMRKRKRARAVDLEEVGEQLVDEDAGPEAAAAAARSPSASVRPWRRLSPRQAEIFSLRYLEGLGNLEIARRCSAAPRRPSPSSCTERGTGSRKSWRR